MAPMIAKRLLNRETKRRRENHRDGSQRSALGDARKARRRVRGNIDSSIIHSVAFSMMDRRRRRAWNGTLRAYQATPGATFRSLLHPLRPRNPFFLLSLSSLRFFRSVFFSPDDPIGNYAEQSKTVRREGALRVKRDGKRALDGELGRREDRERESDGVR